METIAEKYLTAKKEHFCDFCGKKITKGTLYFDQFNKEAGEVYHWKSCVECEFLFRELYDYMDIFYARIKKSRYDVPGWYLQYYSLPL